MTKTSKEKVGERGIKEGGILVTYLKKWGGKLRERRPEKRDTFSKAEMLSINRQGGLAVTFGVIWSNSFGVADANMLHRVLSDDAQKRNIEITHVELLLTGCRSSWTREDHDVPSWLVRMWCGLRWA